jgi:hypothetical protein
MVHLRKLFNPLLPTLHNTISISSSSSREGEETNMVGKVEMGLDMTLHRWQPLKA